MKKAVNLHISLQGYTEDFFFKELYYEQYLDNHIRKTSQYYQDNCLSSTGKYHKVKLILPKEYHQKH